MRIHGSDGTRGEGLTPDRATVEALIDRTPESGGLAVTTVVIPPGEAMREHDHGGSAALLIPLDGRIAVTSGTQRQDLSRGIVALVDREERIALSNQTNELFTMIVVFTPIPDPSSPDPSGPKLPGADRQIDLQTGALGEVLQWVPVPPGVLDQLNDDEAVHVDLAGHPVCLVRSRGAVHAMLDECSHGHVELSEGDVDDGQVECWMHGSRFDLDTGIPTGPPATEAVPVYRVRISVSGVDVALPPSAPA